ncbi:MAG: molybdenum cofactor guanylyltransferase MobA [Rhodoferax sp.]|nr:molybdenum cofactor guanylyltransferase MobA [Rhodoferax sp.]MDP3654648.1 molybdenum cofactor guanylyltransferase MobA [Rhodoferax sp.]
MPLSIHPKTICAVVLAGGRGTRMGGVDKGLQDFKGQALAWHAVQRLQAQAGGAPGLIAINANRNVQAYTAWGQPVWPDTMEDFAGPLAGFQTALQHCQQQDTPFEYLLTVPCDSPLFPLDLLERLTLGLSTSGADIALAAIPEAGRDGVTTLRAQPVFCLMRTSLQASLVDYMASGGRKIAAWTALHPLVEVPFNTLRDDPRDFANANTLTQLHQLEQT